jgi:hypothetical protein
VNGGGEKLTEDELRLVRHLADTSRQYGGRGIPSGWPGVVSAEVALRLAEKSYRRGVAQGSAFTLEAIINGGIAAGRDYDRALAAWRSLGIAEDWATGELPPEYLDRAGGGRDAR